MGNENNNLDNNKNIGTNNSSVAAQKVADASASLTITLGDEQSAQFWKKKIKVIKLEDYFSDEEIKEFLQQWRERAVNIVKEDPKMNKGLYSPGASDELVRTHMMSNVEGGTLANHDETTLKIYKAIVARLMRKGDKGNADKAVLTTMPEIKPTLTETMETKTDPLALTEYEEELYSDPDTLVGIDATFGGHSTPELYRGGKLIDELLKHRESIPDIPDARSIISTNNLKNTRRPIVSYTADKQYMGVALYANMRDNTGRPGYQAIWCILPSVKEEYVVYLQEHPQLLLKLLKNKTSWDKAHWHTTDFNKEEKPTFELESEQYIVEPKLLGGPRSDGRIQEIYQKTSSLV